MWLGIVSCQILGHDTSVRQPIKVSIELLVATRHSCDMTEKLLKAALNPNKQQQQQSLCHTDPLSKIWCSYKEKPSSKITWPKYRSLTYIIFWEVSLRVILIDYPKYDIHPSNGLTDIRQNHWTMKYRSMAHIYFMRPIFVSHWSIIPNITFSHQSVSKILSKITGPQK